MIQIFSTIFALSIIAAPPAPLKQEPKAPRGTAEKHKQDQSENAKVTKKKKYAFGKLMTLCRKRTFPHFNSKACKKVRIFLTKLSNCSNGATPEYVSASCVAVRKRAAKVKNVAWKKQEEQFLRCMPPDSSDYNLEQCVTYRKDLTFTRKLAFCEQKSFKWHKSKFCSKLRKRYYRKKI